MTTANANRSWRGRVAFTAVLLSSASFLVIACADKEDEWKPYVEPIKGVLLHGDEHVDFSEQTMQQAVARSAGCVKCHTGVHEPHSTDKTISCVDCHGGDGLAETEEDAHPHPRHPEWWPEGGANPERSYVHLMKESWDWVRFVNPGDLRVANVTCGPCHPDHVINTKKSVMSTASHFWGVAAYANGIVSSKRTIFGESYNDANGRGQMVKGLIRDTQTGEWREPTQEEIVEHSLAPFLIPLPHWEITQPGNVLRTFEKGSRLGTAALGFNGAPSPLVGIPDKLEDAGRPNNRVSDRGLGTLNRVDLPILNVHKTRLNDPHLSMLGTNDQPGDYRSSGCTACHVVYANDRMPTHSGPYAKYGNLGHTSPTNPDPTIPKNESGHPIAHEFTSAIPSSQCMVCHHHQPNSFVNSYYGFQMWTYETDGEFFFPEKPLHRSTEEWVAGVIRNPEEAAQRGLWGDVEWLKDSAVRVNPVAKHTQFADYHAHGWMFRAIFKMDRKGNLLDEDGNVIPYDDPEKFKGVIPIEGVPGDHHKPAPAHARRAVHMKDIHAEYGMHCVDCHFTNDVHGNGNIFAEYQAAVEVKCEDCHGTVYKTSDTNTMLSGPASKAPGHIGLSLGDLKTPWGEDQFYADASGTLRQRSLVYPDKEWPVSQVKDSVTPGNPKYSAKAAYYKTLRKDQSWGSVPSNPADLAHSVSKDGTGNGMECYTCHTSWITSCFGCHLPQRSDIKTPVNHFDEKHLRNYATYNPQVARDAEFLLGVAGNVKENRIAPVRSSSAVLISSEDGQRRRIYGGVPTTAANGMSSQVFNTHFPHTVRKTETRQCADCHVSETDDNNAWMAQVLLLGTNTVNYLGHFAYVGTWGAVEAVKVTEWGEPQAVIGSNLHRLAYPDEYRKFVDGGRRLDTSHEHFGYVLSLQHRGEYLYAAEGRDGVTVYDIANVGNKDFSEHILTAPVSPLGQDITVQTKFATAIALPTNNLVTMSRQYRPENLEQRYEYRGKPQNLHESYRYAYVSDRYEGLILIDVDCLHDFDPQNNFIKRAVTFNPGGVLNGAEHLAVAGTTVYVCCDRGVVAVDVSDPLAPRVIAEVGAPHVNKPRSIAVQFRYAFVCDAEGVKVLDITLPERMHAVRGAVVDIADARDIYVAKTYGYVSAGAQGLVILDLETASQPKIDQVYDAGGAISDLNEVKVAMTNASVYGYLADGHNGLHVLQLVTPEDGGRSAYGFSPRPVPELIATFPTAHAAMAVSKGLDRDRAVDESGHQMAVFGRIGGRPLNLEEMRRLYLQNGRLYRVSNEPRPPSNRDSAEIDNRGN